MRVSILALSLLLCSLPCQAFPAFRHVPRACSRGRLSVGATADAPAASVGAVAGAVERDNAGEDRAADPLYVEGILRAPPGDLTGAMAHDAQIIMRELSTMSRWAKAEGRDRRGRRRRAVQALSIVDQVESSSPKDDAILVERLLDRLVQEKEAVASADAGNYASPGSVGHVNARTFNLAIKAWSKSGVKASGQSAQNILRRLMNAFEFSTDDKNGKDNSMRPDVFSFAYAYSAWYRVALLEDESGNAKASSKALGRSDQVLKLMKKSLLGESAGVGLVKDPELITADFNRLLDEWGKSGGRGWASMAERFLFCLDEIREETNGLVGPNVSSFNCVINAWAKSTEKHRCNRAETVLERMEEAGAVKPNKISYTSAIVAWANSGQPNSAKKAQNVLERCIHKYQSGHEQLAPDIITFNAVLNAWAKAATSGEKGAAKNAKKLLQRMENLHHLGGLNIHPDVRSYNLVIGTLARERGAHEAEQFLDSMVKSYAAGKTDVQPDTISYTTVIDVWALQGNIEGTSRVLEKMEESLSAKPTARTYTSVLNALSKSGRSDAGKRAEAILDRIHQLYEYGDKEMKPDTRMYNAIINCFANSKGKSAALKGEQLLSKLERMYAETGDEDIKPDVFTFSSVIKAWSKSKSREGGQRAEAVLKRMEEVGIEPNAHSFNAAISAWSRSGKQGAAAKAESIMGKMEELWKAGNKSMKPNVFTFTSVIDGWAKSGEPGSAQRGEILLKLMEVMYQKGDKTAKPNVRSYTACINAWAKSGDKEAGQKAEKLLERMETLAERGDEGVRPNTYTYTAVIDAFARSWERGSAQHAENILKRMEALSADGDFSVKPNVRTYNSVINAWAKSNELRAAQKAEAILNRMEKMFDAGDKDVKPSVVSYSSTINAWVGSTETGKAQKAYTLLRHMAELYDNGNRDLKPNVVIYTSVINACAESRGGVREKEEALQIAYDTFKELEESEYDSPNHVTYATFLKACTRLIPPGEKRENVAAAMFKRCCNQGQVDENVLTQLRLASEDVFLSLMGGIRSVDINNVSLSDLPPEWTCNVRSKGIKSSAKRL